MPIGAGCLDRILGWCWPPTDETKIFVPKDNTGPNKVPNRAGALLAMGCHDGARVDVLSISTLKLLCRWRVWEAHIPIPSPLPATAGHARRRRNSGYGRGGVVVVLFQIQACVACRAGRLPDAA